MAERDRKNININKRCKNYEVVEAHDQPRLDETRHIEQEEEDGVILQNYLKTSNRKEMFEKLCFKL